MHRWWTGGGVALMLAGISVLVAGCGGGSGLLSIDEPTEIRIGQQAAADLEAQYGVVNDPTQTARIQTIGRRIAAVSSRPNLPWTFKELNTDQINAISLPGGPIYITRGLLALGVSDSELAGVIGHEVAHVNDRDSVHAIERAMTYDLLTQLVLGGSSAVTQQAAQLAIQYALELPKSRQAEYSADSVGIRLAYNAGYPATGLPQFLRRLLQVSGPTRTPEWLSTHPATEERITRAEQIAQQVQGQPRPVPIALTEDEKRDINKLQTDALQEAAQEAQQAADPPAGEMVMVVDE